MIVQPDFVEHFKTKALIKLTKDEASPLAVLRLWGHCQNSRRWQFPNMTAEQLAALCAWGDRKPACHTALVKAGFLKRLPEGGFEAHQWDQQNGKLIANWTNGPKGGRPKKGAKSGPENNPNANPRETDGLATGNPPETDKRRSDKRRSDPKSNSGGGVGVPGKGEHATSPVRFPVPQFAPLEKGLWSSELSEALAVARAEVRRVRETPEAWVWEERECADALDGIAYCEKAMAETMSEQRRETLQRDLAAFQSRRVKRVKSLMVPEAAACVAAWEARIVGLERAKTGVRK